MLRTSTYENIQCGHGIVNAFGTPMNIHLYIIDGLLIDTGPSRLRASIDFFTSHEINQVAITHIHEDHSGMAWWLEANKKAPIYLSHLSHHQAKEKAKIPLYRTITWGKRMPFTPQAYPEIIETEKHTFQVINTPGHAEDHVTLYEKNKGWLFTGDLYLGTRALVVLKGENIPQTISTLEKLSRLDFDTIFCGHSGIHQASGKENLLKRLDYFLELQTKTEELHKKGLSAKQIDKKLFPKKHPIYYVSSGEWSSYNMINSIINDK